jgi:hypothetical protein
MSLLSSLFIDMSLSLSSHTLPKRHILRSPLSALVTMLVLLNIKVIITPSCFLILSQCKLCAWSELCSTLNIKTPSLRCNPQSAGGETAKPIMLSTDLLDGLDIDPSDLKLLQFSPEELLGQTFVRTMDDGRNVCAKILRKIQDLDTENHAEIKFLVELVDGGFDEINSYNILSNLVEVCGEEEIQPQDNCLLFEGNKGPISDSFDYKGSSYNVLVVWKDASESFNPLDQFIRNDPVTLAT